MSELIEVVTSKDEVALLELILGLTRSGKLTWSPKQMLMLDTYECLNLNAVSIHFYPNLGPVFLDDKGSKQTIYCLKVKETADPELRKVKEDLHKQIEIGIMNVKLTHDKDKVSKAVGEMKALIER